jgi:hypothetical protein
MEGDRGEAGSDRHRAAPVRAGRHRETHGEYQPDQLLYEATIGDFPSEPQRFAVVALLTDGFGEIALDVVIERLDNEDEVYRESQRVRFSDRVQEVRFLYRVTRCIFPEAGTYEVNLEAEGQVLARHRIMVV